MSNQKSSQETLYVNVMKPEKLEEAPVKETPLARRTRMQPTPVRKPRGYKSFIIDEMGEEGGEEEDTRYVCYQSHNFVMQHKHYAAVNFILLRVLIDEIRIIMDIFAADDVRVQIIVDEPDELTDADGSEEEPTDCSRFEKRKFSCEHKLELLRPNHSYLNLEEELQVIQKLAIKINIGADFELKVTDEVCQIGAIMERYDQKCGPVRDILRFGFQFDDDICSVFQEFVRIISEFKNYRKPTWKDIYFVEKTDKECNVQGFEFYKALPPLGEYSLGASNTIVDMTALRTVTDKMSNLYEWYEKDMKKFPRFHKRQKKNRSIYMPRVLAVNIYCKVPRRLQNTEEVQKFLEPFGPVTFKRTRRHITQAVEYYQRPYLRIALKKMVSKMSWRRRHMDHLRRLIIEQQRRGLYQAMLKHKVYPKYFQFMNLFRGHVKHVDFFDFVKYKCLPKETESIDAGAMPEIKNSYVGDSLKANPLINKYS